MNSINRCLLNRHAGKLELSFSLISRSALSARKKSANPRGSAEREAAGASVVLFA